MLTNLLIAAAICTIPFQRVGGHVLVVPVEVGGEKVRFILDTGAGVNVVSSRLAEKLSLHHTGKYTGRRMSGQLVTAPTTRLRELTLGTLHRRGVPAMIMDFDKLLPPDDPEFAGVEGLLSLDFFRNQPITFEYKNQRVVLEDSRSASLRSKGGVSAPIRVKHHAIETSVMLPIEFSNGVKANAEVDTGSGAMILDTKYMEKFGLKPDSPSLQKKQGTDETGNAYVRYFGTLPATVHVEHADYASQSNPHVQFQHIIYDALIGDDFLSKFNVTYDLAGKRMVFSK